VRTYTSGIQLSMWEPPTLSRGELDFQSSGNAALLDIGFSRGPLDASAKAQLICCASSSRGLKSLAPPTQSRGLPPALHNIFAAYSFRKTIAATQELF
jgi:hypothetical protein